MLYRLMTLGAISMFPQGQGQGEGGIMASPITLIVIIGVLFYFVLYRPEKKKRDEREAQLKSLERGDEIVTAGGIHGRITSLTDQIVTVEVAPNVKIRVSRQHVTPANKQAQTQTSSDGKNGDDKKSKKKK